MDNLSKKKYFKYLAKINQIGGNKNIIYDQSDDKNRVEFSYVIYDNNKPNGLLIHKKCGINQDYH